jgi:hypothetical protein
MEVSIIVSMLDTICGSTLESGKIAKSGSKTVSKESQKDKSVMRSKVIEHLWNALGTEGEKHSMTLVVLRAFGELDKMDEFLSLDLFAKKVQKSIDSVK